MAELKIIKSKLIRNFFVVNKLISDANLNLHLVIKVLELSDIFINLLKECDISTLGVSSILSAKKILPTLGIKPIMMTIQKTQDAEDVIDYCSASYNSDINTIRKLSEIAARKKIHHEVILMLNLGSNREGLNADNCIKTIKLCQSLNSKFFKIKGLAANFGCDKNEIFTTKTLNSLKKIKNNIGTNFNFISLGGSTLLEWIKENKLSGIITELRIGEAAFLGKIPFSEKICSTLHDDAILLIGNVLEINRKKLNNKATILLDLGEVHTNTKKIIPHAHKINLIKSSSNYSLFEINDKEYFPVIGDQIPFKLTYKALARTSISPYVKHILCDKEIYV